MLNNANKLKTLWVSASFILLLSVSFTDVNAQTNNTPESRVKSFYSWYLKSMVKQKDPTKNKTVMNSYLSTRFSRWYYSKAGQNVDYDIFVNSQEWNDDWADNIKVGKATIKGNTAVVKVGLSSPPDDFVMKLQISLVKEAGIWKIDRVKN